jgi:hypothetical protein
MSWKIFADAESNELQHYIGQPDIGWQVALDRL